MDKKAIAAMIIGKGPMQEGSEEPSSAPEMSPKVHAMKKFMAAMKSGDLEMGAKAMQDFIDICNYSDEEEDYSEDME